MATFTWNAVTGGDWNLSTNWTPDGVPTAGDEAVFATGGNSYIVTGAATTLGISVDADQVTFAGALDIDGGSFSATDYADVVIRAGAHLNDNGSIDFAAGTLLEVDGTLRSGGGAADVAVVSGGRAAWTVGMPLSINQLYVAQDATFSGDVALGDGGTVNIDTSVAFGGGTITLDGNGTVYIANAAGATAGAYALSETVQVAANHILTLAADPGVAASVQGGIGGAGSVLVNGGDVTLAGLSTYTGGTNVDDGTLTLSGGHAAGAGAIFLNDGALTVQADSTGAAGNETVVGAGGDDTVSALAGSQTVFAGNAATFTFSGGGGQALVVGDAGILDATGGAGADTIYGGSSGQDVLMTGIGPTTLVSNCGGTLTAFGAAANTLVAAGGNTTLSGGGSSGDNLYFTSGTGTTVVEAGSGVSTVVASGAVNSVFGATGTQDVFLSGGVTQLDFLGGFEGGTNAIIGFNAGDSILLTNYQPGEAQNVVVSAVVNSGDTILTLSDSTQIVLFGYTGVTAATFT